MTAPARVTTAEVEVLTAEVRVLMVGSRQVTLSVARQLDLVDLDALEPFGRVRTREHDYAVIGKHRQSGVLVIAPYLPQPPILHFLAAELPGRITACATLLRTARQYAIGLQLRYDDWPITVPTECVNVCGKHAGYERHGCEHWEPGEVAPVIARDVRRARQAFAPHVAAAAMPLIVLAGLR